MSILYSFQDFKDNLRTKITEERHLNFLSRIGTNFSQLDNVRNSIMHIHSLSKGEIKNYEKIMFDSGMDKGLKSKINDFWQNEQMILKEKTLLVLAKKYIQTIFDNVDYQDEILYINEKYQNEIVEEEYSNYDDIQDDIMAYIVEEINIFEDELLGDMADELDMLICSYWNKITTDE